MSNKFNIDISGILETENSIRRNWVATKASLWIIQYCPGSNAPDHPSISKFNPAWEGWPVWWTEWWEGSQTARLWSFSYGWLLGERLVAMTERGGEFDGKRNDWLKKDAPNMCTWVAVTLKPEIQKPPNQTSVYSWHISFFIPLLNQKFWEERPHSNNSKSISGSATDGNHFGTAQGLCNYLYQLWFGSTVKM